MDTFCTVNVHILRTDSSSIQLDEVIFQSERKQKIQILLREIQIVFNLSVSTSITVIEAYLVRDALLYCHNDNDKERMLSFIERFMGWLRQFDDGNKYKDVYAKEWKIKVRNNRFRLF